VAKKIQFKIQVSAYSKTGLTFTVNINNKTNLITLKMTYMALDNLFTPAFSTNYFFPVYSILIRVSEKAGLLD
jgi:hypothetical protein